MPLLALKPPERLAAFRRAVRSGVRPWLGAIAAGLLLGLAAPHRAAAAEAHWVDGWSAPPLDIAQGPIAVPGTAPPLLDNVSLRQRVTLAVGGERLRVRFSNVFGTATPLHIAAATVARSTGDAGVAASSVRALRFGGRTAVTVAPGAEVWSDPVAWPVGAGGELAASFHLDRPSAQHTVHSPGRGLTHVALGNAVAAPRWNGAALSPWSHVVTGIDVETHAATRVLVAFGDSITDGNTPPGRPPERYTDRLAERLEAPALGLHARDVQVVVHNAGISGNRLLADGAGPRGTGRFARDVLAQSGVTHTLILIGINDIAYGALLGSAGAPPPEASQIVAGLQGLIDQAHARGVGVLLGTLTPFKGAPNHTPQTEARRAFVNAWIRARPAADATLVDFDRALRDPADPQALNPDYDSGDHLHPSAAGQAAMARAVDLKALLP